MKNKLIIPAAALTIGTATLFGANYVHAQDTSTQPVSIITRMAQKFGLNVKDVQAVFDENRTERQKQMQEKFQTFLNQSVSDGKITEDQKQAILTKHQQLQTKHESQDWQNMTPEERRKTMQTERNELKTWAQTNNIDLTYFFRGFVHPFGSMRGGWHMMK